MIDSIHEITRDRAYRMLAKGNEIHCCRESLPGTIIVATWTRRQVQAAIRKHGAELAGPIATRCGYGMALRDERGILYIETRKGAL